MCQTGMQGQNYECLISENVIYNLGLCHNKTAT